MKEPFKYIYVTRNQFNSIKSALVWNDGAWYYPFMGIYVYIWSE